MNDYLAERLRGLAYISDDDWAQGTLREAADEIERLRGLITAWADAETTVGMAVSGNQDEIWTYRAAWDALRKAVGR